MRLDSLVPLELKCKLQRHALRSQAPIMGRINVQMQNREAERVPEAQVPAQRISLGQIPLSDTSGSSRVGSNRS